MLLCNHQAYGKCLAQLKAADSHFVEHFEAGNEAQEVSVLSMLVTTWCFYILCTARVRQ